jgi:thiol:disulfide interchange protein DsbD
MRTNKMAETRRGTADAARTILLAALPALMLGWPAASMAAPQSDPKTVGHLTVQAFADQPAVQPGQSLTLAVSLKVDDEWYVYWQNPGPEKALPTVVEWTAPDGFQVGPTQYPAPQLKPGAILKGDANVLDGTPVFLTSVRAPESLKPGQEVTFKAKVSWLVCGKSADRGDAQISLTLPAADKGSGAKPANKELFEGAREALPIPAAKAEHLKLSAAVDKETVKPGDDLTATVTAGIETGHHMQSNKPAQEGLIAAVVFMERTAGLASGEVKYPKAQERTDRILGKMSEYSGKIVFRVPIKVSADAAAGPRLIRGVMQSQICNDKGTCYMPQYVAFEVPIRIEGASRTAEASPPATASQPQTMVGGESPDPPKASAETELKTTPQDKPASHKEEAPAKTSSASVEAEQGPAQPQNSLVRFQESVLAMGYFGAILLAFLGGLLMNLMPCVLPVISLKVLSFVRQAHEDRWRVFRLGLTYAGGIMVFFLVFACLMFYGGVGWGELFQNSVFILVMAAVVLALAMSLFGVFTLFTPRVVSELGQKAESQEGYLSALSTGILATLLGTACTAPLLSVAIAYASRQAALQGSLIFVAAGLGMALPFVVLTYNPAWLRFVPKPGPWMQTFEHVMAFVLLGTVIWLLYPLRGQLGDYGLYLSLIFLLVVAFAAWLKGKIEFGAPPARKAKLYAAIVVCLLIGWLLPFRLMATIDELKSDKAQQDDWIALGERSMHGRKLDWSKGIPWQHYSRNLALKDVADGYTVFVDYTADWCASCKTNKKTSLDVEETIKTMRELGVIPYEADYTVRKPEITEDLKRFGRAGVPMYLVYRPGNVDKPEVLPELLTPATVIDALKRAGRSQPTASAKP